MVRPRKIKWVQFKANVTYFKPQGVPLSEMEEVIISVDELEAMRLSEIENMNQTEAAKFMNIHQSTFQRTLKRARKKVADSLVNGKAIKIHGGEFKMFGNGQGRGAGRGLGRGMGNAVGAGVGGICVCPKCGYEMPHTRADPCFKKTCPKCGTKMTRKE